ncbi:MAG: integrase arm-type DNA-binding domain-containing protein [Rubrivivax sp.]|nr:integrase arm-type DNA-binding domain-containing protein [Rubrivivax sp.]
MTTARLRLLTAREVHKAGDGDHADGGNLLLRVRGDSASWVFRYTAPSGKRREMGLGVVHRGSLAQAGDSLTAARDAAHKARELLRSGMDPLAERDRHRQSAAAAETERKTVKAKDRLTLARAARDYHERVIEPSRTTKHAAQWISSLENHIPPELWKAPISSITAPALLAALEGIKPLERARNLTAADAVPETVRRIRQRLESVFEDAQFHGHVTANPAAAIRRKMREAEPGKKARKTRNVSGERMKAGVPHLVHLSPRAVEILRGQLGQDALYVFPGTMPGAEGKPRPQSNMAMLAALDRLSVRDKTTVHGLCRATFSTWAYETAAARGDVIEACLAHNEADKIKRAYNRAEFADERAALLRKWATYLDGAQVIEFKGKAA